MELWKPVLAYEGLYEVSSFGRVRSLSRYVRGRSGYGGYFSKPRILKQALQGSSRGKGTYPGVTLYLDGIKQVVLVHTIVLEAFEGKCPEGLQACHGDGNPLNNRKTNLRWDTPKANQHDRIRHGTTLRGQQNPLSKLTPKITRFIRRSPLSGVKLAAKLKVHPSTINRARRGTTWSYPK